MSLLHAIETTGTVESGGVIRFDETPSLPAGSRIRAILMLESDDIRDDEWLSAIARNPAFQDLADPSEDVYSIADGQPYHGTV
jgi:hypothetical protein